MNASSWFYYKEVQMRYFLSTDVTVSVASFNGVLFSGWLETELLVYLLL